MNHDRKEIQDLKIALLRTQAEVLRLQESVRRMEMKNVANTNDQA